jgi:hypothetical protein
MSPLGVSRTLSTLTLLKPTPNTLIINNNRLQRNNLKTYPTKRRALKRPRGTLVFRKLNRKR